MAPLTAEMRQCMQALRSASVPLATARAIWVNRALRSHVWIRILQRKNDRMAAGAHAVCGDLLVAGCPGKRHHHVNVQARKMLR